GIFSLCLTVGALCKSSDNSSCRACSSRDQRQGLKESDFQGYRVADAFGRGAFIFFKELVAKQEEDPADNKHASHHVDTFQQYVDVIAKEQSNHCCGKECNEELLVEVERLEEPFPVQYNDRKDRAKLVGNGKQFCE